MMKKKKMREKTNTTQTTANLQTLQQKVGQITIKITETE